MKQSKSTMAKNYTEHKNGHVSLFSGIIYTFFVVIILFISILIYPILYSDIEPESFIVPEPPKYEGYLKVNNLLIHSEILFQNNVSGPEAPTEHNGSIYAGLHDGRFVKFNFENNSIESIIQFGRNTGNCGTYEDEPLCGRPLGFRIQADGTMYIADSYYGLYKVELTTKHQQLLFPINTPIEGKNITFLNDIDFDNNGVIYFTHSSSKWERRDYMKVLLESKSDGRLISYNTITKEFHVLIDNLSFPDGCQLSPNQEFILVSELNRFRIWKYHINGVKSGQKEIFIENLPGLPDNIRLSKRGGYWVAFGTIRNSDDSFFDWVSDKPYIRKFFAWLDRDFLKRLGSPYGLVAHINQDGIIDETLHDSSGEVIGELSQVIEYNGYLYLGNYQDNYLGRLKYP